MGIKIKKFLKKFFFVTPCLFLTTASAISCSSTNQFYIANFESYMSEDLMTSIEEEYGNVNFRTYATNEDLERNFTKNYDIAIPSVYLVAKMANNGMLEVIDWSKFNLYKLDENGFATNEKIKTAADALTLFTKQTQKILTSVYYLKDFPNPEDGGLLNYCVPYFLQDFIFTYKSDVQYDFSSSPNYQWNQIIDYVSKITGTNNQINRIAMIDDFRSIYSIPRLMQTNGETVNPGNPIINENPDTPLKPIPNQTYSISVFEKTFNYLKDAFTNKNSFLLNSDSGTILNDFASINGSDAGIMYNGDVLYAFQGGDNYSSDESFSEWLKHYFSGESLDLQIARPQKTLMVLDAMVINKNSKNKQEAYDIVKRVALEGSDKSLYLNQQENEYNYNSIIEVDNQDAYVYGPMINFDYVQYTSPLKSIYNFVDNSLTKFETIGGYFTDLYSHLVDENILNENQYSNYIKSLVDVFRIPYEPSNTNMLEQNLSDINKSNMYYAFQKIKQGL